MSENMIELSQKTAKSVEEILRILRGDEMSEGIISLVLQNARNIEKLNEQHDRALANRSMLGSVAMGLALLVPVLVFFDRMILVSEVRKTLGLYGYQAVSMSVLLDLLKLAAMIFVVVILVLRLIGVGTTRDG